MITFDFLNTKTGRILISLIWGFGLATFFKKTCRGDRCIVVKAPEFNSIEDKVFAYQGLKGKCFKYHPNIDKCDKEAKETVCVFNKK